MCNVRKGTSTRKPRLTQVTQQFAKIENQIEQERKKEKRKENLLKTRSIKRLSNSSIGSNNKFANGSTIAITVKGVTVFITDIELTSSNEHDLTTGKSEACNSNQNNNTNDENMSIDNIEYNYNYDIENNNESDDNKEEDDDDEHDDENENEEDDEDDGENNNNNSADSELEDEPPNRRSSRNKNNTNVRKSNRYAFYF